CVALSPQHDGDIVMGVGEVVLPVGISRVGPDETLSDGVCGLMAVERGCEIALSPQHTANSDVGVGEVALPAGISRIGLDHVLPAPERGLMAGESAAEQ